MEVLYTVVTILCACRYLRNSSPSSTRFASVACSICIVGSASWTVLYTFISLKGERFNSFLLIEQITYHTYTYNSGYTLHIQCTRYTKPQNISKQKMTGQLCSFLWQNETRSGEIYTNILKFCILRWILMSAGFNDMSLTIFTRPYTWDGHDLTASFSDAGENATSKMQSPRQHENAKSKTACLENSTRGVIVR